MSDPTHDWPLSTIFVTTPKERAWFADATRGLPERLDTEPYTSQAHCVRAFRMAHKLADNPLRILEIGFNLGHSAACWLKLGCNVTSIDTRDDERVQAARFILGSRFGPRLIFLLRDDCASIPVISSFLAPDTLAYIDGAHDHLSVLDDIMLCRRSGLTRYLFDDWHPHWGPGVQPAIREAGLLPLAVLGNMAYCVEPDAFGYEMPPPTPPLLYE